MAKSFFSDEECRAAGFSQPMINTLRKVADFVDAFERLAAAEGEIAATNTAVDALQESQEDAALSLASLDSRVDAFELLAPFVRQDQTSAWADATGTLERTTFATYTAAVISNPPTQAEVQAVANALQNVSRRLAGVINDLRANGALT